MTDEIIRESVTKIEAHLRLLEKQKELTLLELRHAREDCPHHAITWWTNNDGDGQFRVERCEVCGLQQDGGLPNHDGQTRTKRSA
jgi:hypothetical protein